MKTSLAPTAGHAGGSFQLAQVLRTGLLERLEKGALANLLVAGYQCHSLSSRRGGDEAIGGIVRTEKDRSFIDGPHSRDAARQG
jgi:hypothetical protein